MWARLRNSCLLLQLLSYWENKQKPYHIWVQFPVWLRPYCNNDVTSHVFHYIEYTTVGDGVFKVERSSNETKPSTKALVDGPAGLAISGWVCYPTILWDWKCKRYAGESYTVSYSWVSSHELLCALFPAQVYLSTRKLAIVLQIVW